MQFKVPRQLILLSFISQALCDSSKSIAENLAEVPELSTLLSVVSSEPFQEVAQLLSGDGEFTLFAPNNDAFTAANLDPEAQAELILNTLKYHAIDSKIESSQIETDRTFVNTLLTDSKYVSLPDGKGQVIGAFNNGETVELIDGSAGQTTLVVQADIEASNGVIHVIDRVLTIPPDVATVLQGTSTLSSLAELLTQQQLVSPIEDIQGVTIFAPTNEALSDVPDLSTEELTEVLQYHVVPEAVVYSSDITKRTSVETLEGDDLVAAPIEDGGVQVNNAEVVVADVLLKNGVAHIINQVLQMNSTDSVPDNDSNNDDNDNNTDSEDSSDESAALFSSASHPILLSSALLTFLFSAFM